MVWILYHLNRVPVAKILSGGYSPRDCFPGLNEWVVNFGLPLIFGSTFPNPPFFFQKFPGDPDWGVKNPLWLVVWGRINGSFHGEPQWQKAWWKSPTGFSRGLHKRNPTRGGFESTLLRKIQVGCIPSLARSSVAHLEVWSPINPHKGV